MTVVLTAADANAPAGGREFGGVAQKVPEDLLEPPGIGVDDVRGVRAHVHAEVQLPGFHIWHAHLDRVPDDRTQLDGPAIQLDLAAGDAGDIKQIVDEPGLQLDVAPDELHVFPVALGQLRVRLEHRRGREHGAGAAYAVHG